MKRLAVHLCLLILLCSVAAAPASAQDDPSQTVVIPSMMPDLAVQRRVCPGDPPGNLASIDCAFTQKRRGIEFLGGSVTDQAVLGAAFFGTMAQIRHQPREWEQDWRGLGQRIGSRYVQRLAKGTAEYAVGSLVGNDPRHLSCASDPRTIGPCSGGRRIRHAFMDWFMMRESSKDGTFKDGRWHGRRFPNAPLFAASLVSGSVGDLWYPDRQTTRSQTLRRTGNAVASALMSSFYHEFSPEVGRVLGRLMKRGGPPEPAATPKETQTPKENQQ